MNKKFKIKLENESLNFLKNYQKNVKNLSKKDKKFLEKLIKNREKSNKKEAELWINSLLGKIAIEKLKKPYKTIKEINTKLNISNLFNDKELNQFMKEGLIPAEIYIYTMWLILEETDNNNKIHILRDFLQKYRKK